MGLTNFTILRTVAGLTRLIVFVVLVLASLVVITQGALVSAQDGGDIIFKNVCTTQGSKDLSSVCQHQPDTNPISGPDGILIRIAGVIAVLAGVFAVIMVIVGGIKLTSSRGDPNSVTNARNTLIAAILGVVISFSAASIIYFVIRRVNPIP